MGEKYANPPIVEAVCEFRLAPDTKWDLTVPGLVYEKLDKSEFPNKEQRIVQEVNIVQDEKGVQQRISTSERVLFLTGDGKAFLQMGPNLLAINCLKPYPTWDAFKPRIEKAFGALTKTIEVRGLERIALRYINRIEMTGESIDLDHYFEFRPFLGPKLPQDMAVFKLGCVLQYSDGRDAATIQLANAVPEKPEHNAVILDIEYALAQSAAVSVADVLQWVDDGHQRVEEIFEGCITDALRQVFREAPK